MKVILIMPGVGRKKEKPYVGTWKMEPLMAAQLSALTPSDIELEFYDDRLENIPYDEDCDLVGITVETYTARRAYKIASEFRRRGIPVVLGGYHPTLLPEEAKGYADAIVIGEAEGVWKKIIEDARRRKLKSVYLSKNPPLNGIIPKRDIYKDKKYLALTLVETARGCPFFCEFCSVSQFYLHTYRTRPIRDVIKEIEYLGTKRIFFVDDNLTANIPRTKRLLRELIPLKIKWAGQGTLLLAEDDELLSLLKKSGCVALLIGFESLNKKNLERMNKRFNKGIGYFNKMIEKIHQTGIGIYATFIFGYEGDTEDVFKRTFEFAIKNKFLFSAFNHLLPFPGTRLYKRLKRERRLTFKKWWLSSKYRYGDIPFKPLGILPEELKELCKKYRRKFYTTSSIFRRATNFKANLQSLPITLIYFHQNLLAEKEVEMKMGLPLGEGLDSKEK